MYLEVQLGRGHLGDHRYRDFLVYRHYRAFQHLLYHQGYQGFLRK